MKNNIKLELDEGVTNNSTTPVDIIPMHTLQKSINQAHVGDWVEILKWDMNGIFPPGLYHTKVTNVNSTQIVALCWGFYFNGNNPAGTAKIIRVLNSHEVGYHDGFMPGEPWTPRHVQSDYSEAIMFLPYNTGVI